MKNFFKACFLSLALLVSIDVQAFPAKVSGLSNLLPEELANESVDCQNFSEINGRIAVIEPDEQVTLLMSHSKFKLLDGKFVRVRTGKDLEGYICAHGLH